MGRIVAAFGAAALGITIAVTTGIAIVASAHAETGKRGSEPGEYRPSKNCSLRNLRSGLSSCPGREEGQRLPAKEVIARIEEAGFKDVFSIEFEHGRYEIEAFDEQGRKVVLFADPETGKPRMKSYGWIRLSGSFLEATEVVSEVAEAGYKDVYAIGREHALYEVIARDPNGQLYKLAVHPKTGRLIRHPKTNKPLSVKVDARDAAGPYVVVSGILSKLNDLGYRHVYTLEPKGEMYELVAHNPNGNLVLMLVDPETGEIHEHP